MSSWNDVEYAEALELHRQAGPIDLHVDSIIQQRLFRYNIRRAHRAGFKGQPLFWHADVPRMLEGGYGGACMGIHYWPWESEGCVEYGYHLGNGPWLEESLDLWVQVEVGWTSENYHPD